MAIVGAFAVPHPPIMFPEIGRGEERKIQSTIDAYREAARRAGELYPETLIVLSPHSIMYQDYFHISPGKQASGSFKAFGRPDVVFSAVYDTDLATAIAGEAKAHGLPAGPLGERDKTLDHGTMIPLRFFGETCPQIPIVRIGLSGLSLLEHYRFGKCIARAAQSLGRRVAVIASGDLSHKLKADGPYGYAEQGPQFDSQIMDILTSGDFEKLLQFDPLFCEEAAECGLRSFVIMAGTLDGKSVCAEKLSYEGPFGVGYGVVAFKLMGDDQSRRCDELFLKREREELDRIASREDPYVKLARISLETYVRTGRLAVMPSGLPEEMLKRRAGVFVSLKKDGQLRGCIGTISAVTGCIAEEILRNAVSAGTEDPRFSPVKASELPRLVYDVDVLSEAERASEDQLDVKRYGVIVTSGRKRGLLLPNLDGVTTVRQQIDIALRKADIGAGEVYFLERFEVVRHL